MNRNAPLSLFGDTVTSQHDPKSNSIVCILMLIGLLLGCSLTPFIAQGQGLDGPLSLSQINSWGYQIQGINEEGIVDSLAASHYDMLVLEPTRTDWSSVDKFFDTKGMIDRLKNTPASDGVHRKLLIAYIDIGEAEDWRWYWTWSTGWNCTGNKPADWPAYILSCDPDGWTGNYPIAYWEPDWKDIIIYGQNTPSHPDRDYNSVIDEAIRAGFDGIYLDWVEAFENEEVMAEALRLGKDPAEEMIAFITEMRSYAQQRNPDFLIIQQNAAALIDGHSNLTSVIDALAQEAIWYDGDATDEWDDPDGYDYPNETDLIDYYLGYLEDYSNAGLPLFNCEYALSFASDAYQKSSQRGFIPYVTRRSLSSLTTTPPPGYGVQNAAPTSAPSLTSPASNATGVSLETTLDWNGVTGATSYQAQVATSSGFSSSSLVVDTSNLSNSAYDIPSGTLSGSMTYYWRVRAANSAGVGPWSITRAFQTTLAAPTSAPSLTSPASNATGVSLAPTLDWNGVTGATSYQAQVATSSGFSSSSLVVDTSNLSNSAYDIPSGTLSGSMTYYWRVRAANSAGVGPWSNFRFFDTATATSTEGPADFPEAFSFQGNYPNPFRSVTTITLGLPEVARIQVSVYDVRGRELLRLQPFMMAAGRDQKILINTHQLPSGVYLCRVDATLTTGTTQTATRPITIVN